MFLFIGLAHSLELETKGVRIVWRGLNVTWPSVGPPEIQWDHAIAVKEFSHRTSGKIGHLQIPFLFVQSPTMLEIDCQFRRIGSTLIQFHGEAETIASINFGRIDQICTDLANWPLESSAKQIFGTNENMADEFMPGHIENDVPESQDEADSELDENFGVSLSLELLEVGTEERLEDGNSVAEDIEGNVIFVTKDHLIESQYETESELDENEGVSPSPELLETTTEESVVMEDRNFVAEVIEGNVIFVAEDHLKEFQDETDSVLNEEVGVSLSPELLEITTEESDVMDGHEVYAKDLDGDKPLIQSEDETDTHLDGPKAHGTPVPRTSYIASLSTIPENGVPNGKRSNKDRIRSIQAKLNARNNASRKNVEPPIPILPITLEMSISDRIKRIRAIIQTNECEDDCESDRWSDSDEMEQEMTTPVPRASALGNLSSQDQKRKIKSKITESYGSSSEDESLTEKETIRTIKPASDLFIEILHNVGQRRQFFETSSSDENSD